MVAGKRQADRAKRPKRNQFVPESRRAWVTTKEEELVLYHNPPVDEDTTASVSVVSVRLRDKWTTSLTSYTLAELEAMEKLYKLAFELAKPLAAERDRKARENHEAGIGTDYRLYRRPPVTVGIEGDSDEHDQSVYFRPPPVPLRFGHGRSAGGDVRGDSGAVAADRASEDATEDSPA